MGGVLMFAATVAGHVYMKLTTGDEMALFLAGEVATVLSLGRRSGTVEELQPTCAECNSTIPTGASYCPYCGKKYRDNRDEAVAPVVCSDCGAPFRAGVHFCIRCGASVKTGERLIPKI